MWKATVAQLLWLCFLFFSPASAWGFGVISSESRPDGLCATFVDPYPNYICHEFSIATPDGFRLGVQRVYSGAAASALKAPVLLYHGVLSGGDTWVLNPPEESPAFVLADAGYDVWIGNTRTTRYSYGHQYLTEGDEVIDFLCIFFSRAEVLNFELVGGSQSFWDWSLDELAAVDLPNMMHLVNNITNKKIYYIGFSQGTQAALAALSEGNLGGMMEKAALLAPVAYVSHTFTPIGVAAAVLHLDKVFEALRLHSFSTKTKTGKQYVDLICAAANLRCYEEYTSAFTGINCCINNSRRAFYDKYETQATSTKNLVHLAQLYRSGRFQKYDYGEAENKKRYNSRRPPAYDVSKVQTHNMLLAHGQMDALANALDVERLMAELSPGFKSLREPSYAHLDFILAYNCKKQIYERIMAFFENQY